MTEQRGLITRSLVLVLAGVMVLAASGCGDDGDDAAGSADGQTPDSEVDAPESEFAPDGELRVGANLTAGPFFDPIDDTGAAVGPGWWMKLIYGTMIHQVSDGEDGSEPGLATEWSAPDPQTVELTLREDAKFSDGTPVDAEAVKSSFDRCRDGEGFKLPTFKAYESSEVLDDTHLRIDLNQPIAGAWTNYLFQTSIYCMGIVSPTAVEAAGGGSLGDNPVGAGPYMLDSYEKDQRIVLVPNPHFYDPSQQTFAKIEIVQVAAGAPTVTALASGQIDVARIESSEVSAVEAIDGVRVVGQPSDVADYIGVCPTTAPFDNVDARRAVARATDRQEFVDVTYQGDAVVNTQLLTPTNPFYSAAGEESLAFDVDEAAALAESSGLAGQTVDLLFDSARPTYVTNAELVQAQLEAIGVTVNLVPTQNFLSDLNGRQPDLWVFGYSPTLFAPLVTPGEVLNPCNQDFADVVAAMESAFTGDADTDQQAWEDLQAAVAENVAVIPLLHKPNTIALSDRVGGDVYMPANVGANVLLDWSRIGIVDD